MFLSTKASLLTQIRLGNSSPDFLKTVWPSTIMRMIPRGPLVNMVSVRSIPRIAEEREKIRPVFIFLFFGFDLKYSTKFRTSARSDSDNACRCLMIVSSNPMVAPHF